MVKHKKSGLPYRIDITGQVFNGVTAIRHFHTDKKMRIVFWACKCPCGEEMICRSGHLKAGKYIGCVACKAARTRVMATRHGASTDQGTTRLYRIWSSMRERCRNPKTKDYKYWGGKGIKVCDEWQKFEGFRDWANANGYVEGLSIDRVNSSRNYCPENCEWVTRSENCRRAHSNHLTHRRPKAWTNHFPIEMLWGPA